MISKLGKLSYRGSRFNDFSKGTAHFTGHPLAFMFAVGVIALWLISGPMFGFSDTWQLVINTGTTIVTFLMVFLIQNTQNRDNYALQLKLDEIIRALEGAHTSLLDIEELSEEELLLIKKRYQAIAEMSREKLRRGEKDIHCPDVEINKEDGSRAKTAR